MGSESSMIPLLQILEGDAIEQLRSLPSDSVQCVVTSPPYFGLRDYGVAGQIGLEESPIQFVMALVKVFREVRRVLKPDGAMWLNIGDTYATPTSGQGHRGLKALSDRYSPRKNLRKFHRLSDDAPTVRRPRAVGYREKELIGIPWRLAFALQDDGWMLRQDIIWQKPNPMPESVSDRCTRAHEYLFLMVKSGKYFWDKSAMLEPTSGTAAPRMSKVAIEEIRKARAAGAKPTHSNPSGHGVNPKALQEQFQVASTSSLKVACSLPVAERNRRTVWSVQSEPFSGAHFATFPTALVRPCILATSRPGDVVLDPFGGSGTTGAVAIELGRRAVLVEINPDYVNLIRQRCSVTPGLGI